ncbi:hypothetical protein [Pseudomonas anguilliseptica]|uniref:hypothetical protein n=1 Tax=Pseudomonas anguilliseptica TaxID=53406 RepID=UPI0022AE75EF|nr:hypothetical protein [Pseudomonas anguilliseptica]MCZ4321441.1 hypothetical protein [Pseudomonas anguilliseptica]
MAGWMVEAAYKYAKVAEISLRHGNLGAQSEVNAAIAVELLLKSLRAVPVDNARAGTVAQQFMVPRIGDGHDLLGLYELIPGELRTQLRLERYRRTFEEKRHVFKLNRYEYESTAARSYDDTLLQLAAELIPVFVRYFLDAGSDDPWLRSYQAEPAQFALPDGIRLY